MQELHCVCCHLLWSECEQLPSVAATVLSSKTLLSSAGGSTESDSEQLLKHFQVSALSGDLLHRTFPITVPFTYSSVGKQHQVQHSPFRNVMFIVGDNDQSHHNLWDGTISPRDDRITSLQHVTQAGVTGPTLPRSCTHLDPMQICWLFIKDHGTFFYLVGHGKMLSLAMLFFSFFFRDKKVCGNLILHNRHGHGGGGGLVWPDPHLVGLGGVRTLLHQLWGVTPKDGDRLRSSTSACRGGGCKEDRGECGMKGEGFSTDCVALCTSRGYADMF